MRARLFVSVCAAMTLVSCARNGRETYQGYVEGEFVHVGAGVGGRLERLFVSRGQTVQPQTALFELEASQETAGVKQADATLNAAQAQLADLETGRRRQEVDVVTAQVEQAVAAEQQSASQLARDTAQLEAGGIPRAQLEASRAKHDIDVARLRELRGQLAVADLAARPEQIHAQRSQVAAARAAVEEAKSRLDQKRAVTTQTSMVVDTLFREGEWVPPGSPVVRLLAPANVKVRFFVPQTSISLFPIGRNVTVRCDGCAEPIEATVSYVSTEPEYTPPIIYSNETRAKLVFMLEARPAIERAALLRPGQPVEVLAQ